MMKRWLTSSIVISWMLCCVAISDAAQNQDIVAVITELKFNGGNIGVVNPGKTTAEKPAVLQSLYAGSRIQATGDASAVILFTDGMRTVKIDEKNSPFEVKPTAKGASGSGRLKEVSNLLEQKNFT